jgi:hypothetical protein
MIIDLKYNPYRRTTKILIDGKEIEENSELNSIKEGSLQNWVKKFERILKKEYGYKNLDIKFTGREIDFQDLKNNMDENQNIKFEFIKILSTEERLKKLESVFKKIQDGTYEELKTPEILGNFRKVFEQEFEIAVVATMSSGKSTLLNSFLGKNLIPSKNQACTAKITRIEDDKSINFFSAEIYDQEDKLIKKYEKIDAEDLKTFNDGENIGLIKLKGNVRNISSNQSRLVLIDTPGPNNSMDIKHKELTYNLLKKDYKPLVLYILSYTQLGVDDDRDLLKNISEEMNKGDLQSTERFIFVLNKFDARFEDDNDDDINKVLGKVKEYLEGLSIKNPIIIPTAARTALFMRLNEDSLNNKSVKQRNTYKENIVDEYRDNEFNINNLINISNTIKKSINFKIEKYSEENDDEKLAELLTGVPALENYIEDYLEKYSVPEKIVKSLESFKIFLDKEKFLDKINEMLTKNENLLKNMKDNIDTLNHRTKEIFPQIKTQMEKKVAEITKKLKQLTIKQEGKVEKINGDILKEIEKTDRTTDKSKASKDLDNFIRRLQQEYIKIKGDIEKEIRDTIKNEFDDLMKTYIGKFEKMDVNLNNKELEGLLKKILSMTLEENIVIERTKLDDMLNKSYR